MENDVIQCNILYRGDFIESPVVVRNIIHKEKKCKKRFQGDIYACDTTMLTFEFGSKIKQAGYDFACAFEFFRFRYSHTGFYSIAYLYVCMYALFYCLLLCMYVRIILLLTFMYVCTHDSIAFFYVCMYVRMILLLTFMYVCTYDSIAYLYVCMYV